ITTSPSSELLTSSLPPDYFNESPSLLKSPAQPIQFNEIPLMSPLLTTTPHTPTSPPPTSIVSSPSLPPTPTPPSGPQVPSAEWVTGGGNVTVSGKPCIFPFVYKGQEYEQCIQEDAKGPWCPTLLNKHKQPIASEFCKGNDASVKPPLTGNDTSVKPLHVSSQRQFTKDGVECIFPFTYKGIQYWNCSSTERPALWCATLVNAKLQPLQSGYCANNIASIPFQPPPTVIGMAMTIQRGPCIFPFLYRGIVYEQCACVDAPACWCPTSLTRNNEPAVSDYCRDDSECFPKSPTTFMQVRFVCISDTHNRTDCLHYSIPDGDVLLHGGDFTIRGDPHNAHVFNQWLGLGAPVTVDGWACHFPFRYKGRTYTKCTSEDSNHPWCATIVNDSDQPTESGYCKGSNQPPPSKPPVRVPQPSS
ncbi:Epididymal sperm-binding protein 1-like, partial [Homarus americanus]